MNWKEWCSKREVKGYVNRCIDTVQRKLELDDYQMMWLMWWDGFLAGVILWLIFG